MSDDATPTDTPADELDRTDAEVAAELSEQVAQLELALDKALQRRDEAIEERDRWRDHKLPDDEAQALAGCIKALDKLDRGISAGMGFGSRDTSGFERILRYLADRYGVTWPHVDHGPEQIGMAFEAASPAPAAITIHHDYGGHQR